MQLKSSLLCIWFLETASLYDTCYQYYCWVWHYKTCHGYHIEQNFDGGKFRQIEVRKNLKSELYQPMYFTSSNTCSGLKMRMSAPSRLARHWVLLDCSSYKHP